MAQKRVDLALVFRGQMPSRAQAQLAIRQGRISIGPRIVTRSSDMIDDAELIVVVEENQSWASRGGLKLAHALAYFALLPAGRTCLDIGASTGGFTDVLLAHHARKVYAVDVGHNQLSVRLRNDPRVHSMEGINARNLASCAISPTIEALVCDVSFIGLRLALPAGLALCTKGAFAIALIKPQFEAGPAAVGKGGIVRDPAIRRRVCETIQSWWTTLPGWHVRGITDSPITGGDGNHEFLIAAEKTTDG